MTKFYITFRRIGYKQYSFGISITAYNRDFWYIKIYILAGYFEIGRGSIEDE